VLSGLPLRSRNQWPDGHDGMRTSMMRHFYSPNVQSVVECLPSCVGPDNPPRYEPTVYRDLVLAFHNANRFHRSGYGKAATPASP
jgi:hypothetical protein